MSDAIEHGVREMRGEARICVAPVEQVGHWGHVDRQADEADRLAGAINRSGRALVFWLIAALLSVLALAGAASAGLVAVLVGYIAAGPAGAATLGCLTFLGLIGLFVAELIRRR